MDKISTNNDRFKKNSCFNRVNCFSHHKNINREPGEIQIWALKIYLSVNV